MKDILKLYIEFINDFEKELIKEYDLKDKYWNVRGAAFNRVGHVGDYQYRFHGTGCELQKEGIVCDYNIEPYDKGKQYYISFTCYDIKRFVESNHRFKDIAINEKEIQEGLQDFIDDKTLKWLYVGEKRFDSYLISSTYKM